MEVIAIILVTFFTFSVAAFFVCLELWGFVLCLVLVFLEIGL